MTDLERLARILCEADGCNPDVLVYDQSLATDKRGRIEAPLAPPLPTWHHYLLMARAAIEAIMTGAENTDLHAMLKEMLEGKEDAPEPEPEATPEPPPGKPDWRVYYGLAQPKA
jgi:hypothetical protein